MSCTSTRQRDSFAESFVSEDDLMTSNKQFTRWTDLFCRPNIYNVCFLQEINSTHFARTQNTISRFRVEPDCIAFFLHNKMSDLEIQKTPIYVCILDMPYVQTFPNV